MVIASHIIFTTYGFWLPNDPRGSWSDFVRSWELLKHGRATKTTDRRSLAYDEHDRVLRLAAKDALRYPPVVFSGVQALEVVRGFSLAVRDSDYRILACSVMPDHVHMVVARHANPAERIIAHLKSRATRRLLEVGIHPFQQQISQTQERISCWTSRGWKVFIESDDDISGAVDYVNQNPTKAGLKSQSWSFVSRV